MRRKHKTWRKKYARHLRYERTPKGFLCRSYTYMQVRVRRQNGYIGLQLCTRQEFYDWSLLDPDFIRLHANWLINRCGKYHRPTPDRLDSSLGYTIGNMRWVTYLDNVISSPVINRGTQNAGDLGARF